MTRDWNQHQTIDPIVLFFCRNVEVNLLNPPPQRSGAKEFVIPENLYVSPIYVLLNRL